MTACFLADGFEHEGFEELKENMEMLGIVNSESAFQNKKDLARRLARHYCAGNQWECDELDWSQKPDGKALWKAMKVTCPTIRKREAKWINEKVLPHLFKMENYSRLDDALAAFWEWAQCFCEEDDDISTVLRTKIRDL